MMQRIRERDLEAVCQRINRTVNGRESEPYERDENGFRQVPDVFVISYAYGGASLHRNCSVDASGESHGVSDVFGCGHVSKRELYERMHAFLRGVEVVESR